MSKRKAFIAVLASGVALVASPSTGQAQQPAAPDFSGNVQLNADTAVTHGLTGRYVNDDFNVALGGCVTPGSNGLTAPASTTFSSPVLTFSGYNFGPLIGVPANVSADAQLKPGTKAGTYPLIMNCAGKSYRTTFSVTKPQVAKVPAGAVPAGDGSTAELK